MPNDENIYRVITSRAPVVTGAEPTAPEWTDLQGRVGALEDDPKLLAALDDVDATGAAGTVLVKQADGTWKAGSVAEPMEADAGDVATRFGPVTILSIRDGLSLEQHATVPNLAIIRPDYGAGTNQIPRGTHSHQLPSRLVEPITPGGYMSGGTRSLATRNVTLPAGKSCQVEARIDMQVRGGDPGPCYYRLHLAIDGNTRTSGAGENGFWGVSGVPGHPPFSHARTITGTGSAINVSASISYYDGGGFYTDAGELVITVRYDR